SALVYFHGGGWVIGSLGGADGACRALANHGGCVVISIGYRLAPETKFPGPVEDADASVSWVARQAADLGIDPARNASGASPAAGIRDHRGMRSASRRRRALRVQAARAWHRRERQALSRHVPRIHGVP